MTRKRYGKPSSWITIKGILIRFTALASVVYGIVGLLYDFRYEYEYVAVFLILLYSLLLVLRCRGNSPLFLISFFIAYANYSAMAANYFATYYDWYMHYSGTLIAAKGTFSMLTFISVVVLLLPERITPYRGIGFFNRCYGCKNTRVFAYILAVCLIIIALTQSGGFSETGRLKSNQLYEYSYILFIVGFYFCGKEKPCTYILIVLALMFIGQAIIGGNRASVLAIALLLTLLFIIERIPLRRLIPIMLIGFYFFQLVGLFRQNMSSVSLNEILRASIMLFEHGLVWDTAAAAYHQGLAFINYLVSCSSEQVSYLLQEWVKGFFLGGSAVPNSILPVVVHAYYGLYSVGGYGGGFLPLYGYFYFDFLGPILFGIAVAAVFKLMLTVDSESSDFKTMIAIALFCTVPRWWLYSPAPLTRGLLLMAIIGAIATALSKTISARKMGM